MEKRFSELYDFHTQVPSSSPPSLSFHSTPTQLSTKVPKEQIKLLPPFPKRFPFLKSNVAFIERRRTELETYLKSLLDLNYFQRRKYLLRPLGLDCPLDTLRQDSSNFTKQLSSLFQLTPTIPLLHNDVSNSDHSPINSYQQTMNQHNEYASPVAHFASRMSLPSFSPPRYSSVIRNDESNASDAYHSFINYKSTVMNEEDSVSSDDGRWTFAKKNETSEAMELLV